MFVKGILDKVLPARLNFLLVRESHVSIVKLALNASSTAGLPLSLNGGSGGW